MQDLNRVSFKKIPLYLIIFVIGYYLGFQGLNITPSSSLVEDNKLQNLSGQDLENGVYTVSYIIDGDTIQIRDKNGAEAKVRFLAVDTMEMNSKNPRDKCLAKQQKNFTKENLFEKEVKLILDPTQPKIDKYKRILAYVFVVPENTTDNTNLDYFNDLLIKTGNAKVYRASPPATNYQKYLDLQKQSEISKKGIWDLNNCKLN